MRKKFNQLALWSFIIALAIFIFSYFLYHYGLPEGGFSSIFNEEPAKPFVTLLFGIWGTNFLFASVISLVIGRIFFKEK